MKSKLGFVAAAGFSVCAVALIAAAILSSTQTDLNFEDIFDFDGLPRCSSDSSLTATSRDMPWTGGDDITIAIPANVHYRPDNPQTLRISGDPQAIARVVLNGETLEYDCNHRSTPTVDIDLPGRTFGSMTAYGGTHLFLEGLSQRELSLDLSGSASAEGDGALDDLDLSISGSGKARLQRLAVRDLDLNISGSGLAEVSATDHASIDINGSGDAYLSADKLQKLDVGIHGSGTVKGEGRADRLNLEIAGSGDAYLSKIIVQQLDLEIHGSGNAEVAPEDHARIDIEGSGDVALYAEPKSINTNIHGSGDVKHLARTRDAGE